MCNYSVTKTVNDMANRLAKCHTFPNDPYYILHLQSDICCAKAQKVCFYFQLPSTLSALKPLPHP